jgi:hypothetical protein
MNQAIEQKGHPKGLAVLFSTGNVGAFQLLRNADVAYLVSFGSIAHGK